MKRIPVIALLGLTGCASLRNDATAVDNTYRKRVDHTTYGVSIAPPGAYITFYFRPPFGQFADSYTLK